MYFIFGRESCPHCISARKFAKDNNLEFRFIVVDGATKVPAPFKSLMSGHNTVPAVFCVDFIGGNDDFQNYFASERSSSGGERSTDSDYYSSDG